MVSIILISSQNVDPTVVALDEKANMEWETGLATTATHPHRGKHSSPQSSQEEANALFVPRTPAQDMHQFTNAEHQLVACASVQCCTCRWPCLL